MPQVIEWAAEGGRALIGTATATRGAMPPAGSSWPERLARRVAVSTQRPVTEASLGRFAALVRHLDRIGDEALHIQASLEACWVLSQVDWIRDPAGWARMDAGTPARVWVFALARHLIAQYETPSFLDLTLFQPRTESTLDVWSSFARRGRRSDALRRHESGVHLWAHVARGGNLRDAVRHGWLPRTMTRRMWHIFLGTPASASIARAVRRAQWLAVGGQEQFLPVLDQWPIGREIHPCEEADFTFVRWVARHAAALHWRNDLSGLLAFVERERQQPSFSLAGRSPKSVLAAFARRRDELESGRLPARVAGSGFPSTPLELDGVQWCARELTSRSAVEREGRAMHHCVASYWPNVAKGHRSILSFLGGAVATEDSACHRLTIEVSSRSRSIRQVRGARNRPPSAAEIRAIEAWALTAGLRVEYRYWATNARA